MAAQTEFPPQLLAESPSVRVEYFQNQVVAHPHLIETFLDLLQAINHLAPGSLIIVFGPTGVGKTTLRYRLVQHLWEAGRPVIEQDPGHIPVVSIEAAVADADRFSWRDYYYRALTALDEPMLDHKKVPDHLLSETKEPKVTGHKKTTAAYRWALEQALRYRRPAAFVVDEAQHLRRIASGRALLDQMDTIKSLANLTSTTHVLIGTYELLGMAKLSAQLNRRSYQIHFPRYHIDIPEEMLAFKHVLRTFQRHLPLRGEPNLVNRAEYFYEYSAGCVGILKGWLTGALAAALEDGQETLTNTILKRRALAQPQLLEIARDIHKGEQKLIPDSNVQNQLRSFLGMSEEFPESIEENPPISTPRKVAQRSPTRDVVGNYEQPA